LPGTPVTARLLPDGASALILTDAPPALLTVDLAKRRVVARLALPAAPAEMDVSGSMAAVTCPSGNQIVRIEVPRLKTAGTTDAGVSCAPVRSARRETHSRRCARRASDRHHRCAVRRITRPAARRHRTFPFLFQRRWGQMFVSGAGADVVAIVSPYQSEVGETILAGRTPGAMAVSDARNLLS